MKEYNILEYGASPAAGGLASMRPSDRITSAGCGSNLSSGSACAAVISDMVVLPYGP